MSVMSVTVGKIAELVEEMAPLELGEEWDNIGLLAGVSTYAVEKVLLALDPIDAVIDEAIEKGCQMIVSHHPIMRNGLKKINESDFIARKVIKLLENKIALYAAHTNLDRTKGGVNDSLCALFELTDIRDGEDGILRFASLKSPMTLKDVAKSFAEKLKTPYLPVIGDPDKTVKRLAVVGGGGIGYMDEALKAGVDLFLTGDVKYHDANRALDEGLSMIDMTHYGSESKVIEPLARHLENKRDEYGLSFSVIISEIDGQPFKLCKGV